MKSPIHDFLLPINFLLYETIASVIYVCDGRRLWNLSVSPCLSIVCWSHVATETSGLFEASCCSIDDVRFSLSTPSTSIFSIRHFLLILEPTALIGPAGTSHVFLFRDSRLEPIGIKFRSAYKVAEDRQVSSAVPFFSSVSVVPICLPSLSLSSFTLLTRS